MANNLPDFPNLPNLNEMIRQSCEIIANVRGIPYDFNGALSLENKFTVLFKTVMEMFNVSEQLIESYKTLYEFVKNYFENLDLQEEINNKIQSMVDDGSFWNAMKNLLPMITPQMYGAVGDGVHDDTAAIKNAIANNPNRTIFFPDGTYLISSIIFLNPANDKSVSLSFSKNAVVKASDSFANQYLFGIQFSGTYDYYADNAIIRIDGMQCDCNGKNFLTDGIVSSDYAYPFELTNCHIRNVGARGIYIMAGYHSNSSDCVIRDCTFLGNDLSGSTGILVAGSDNKFSNIRLHGFRRGMIFDRGGQICVNVHTLHHGTFDLNYANDSIGFYCRTGALNEFTNCYADSHATGWVFDTDAPSTLTGCICFWWNNLAVNTYAIRVKSGVDFNSKVENMVVAVSGNAGDRRIMGRTGTGGGNGKIIGLTLTNKQYMTDLESDYANSVYNATFGNLHFTGLSLQVTENSRLQTALDASALLTENHHKIVPYGISCVNGYVQGTILNYNPANATFTVLLHNISTTYTVTEIYIYYALLPT